MLLVGVSVAVQSRVNGQLADELGSGLLAPVLTALVTFGVGLLITTVGLALLPEQRRRFGHLRRSLGTSALPWRFIWGGALGTLFVLSQAVAVGPVGLAVFTMAVVLGQTAGGAAADRLGLGPAGVQPLSLPRLIAAATALAAVVLASATRVEAPGAVSAAVVVALLVFTVVAGLGSAVQQALNGRVGVVAGPYAAAWLNTAVASATLTVGLVVALLLPHTLTGWPGQWWLYTGGLLAVTIVALSAVLVRVHGVLVLMLCTIAGQMAAAWAIAVAESSDIAWTTHLATSLVILGVGIAVLARRRVV